MWINSDSYLLLKNAEAVSFAQTNDLKTFGNIEGAHFFNKSILIKIYEERQYLHADYYDLEKLRWGRELENSAVGEGIIPLEQAQLIYKESKEGAYDDCLRLSSMARFFFYLKVIDTYMQD